MLNSEFNLYKREWLSLVFRDRNQQYGAYELRSHYADVLTRAMGITFFIVAAVGIAATVISRNRHVEVERPTYIDVHIVPPKDVIHEAKVKEPPKTKTPPAKAPAPVSTQNLNYVAKPDELVTKDPEPVKMDVASGPVDKIIPGTGGDNIPVMSNGDGVKGGTGNGPGIEVEDNTTYVGVDEMPVPIGGEKAWSKFLQKNLRYPTMAQEQGVSGKSFVSFIVEKDGHLSNITIERKGGYGFDEEAARVLKLAAAWKPGKQNGQAVRVKYVIPINFQLAE